MQTLHPEHPWLARLVDGGYAAFIEPILAGRREQGLPPYAHLAILRAESREQQAALTLLQELKHELLREHRTVQIIGPVPAPMQRRAGFNRLQLLLSHAQRAPLHAALDAACRLLETRRTPGVERWHIDVDPQEGA